MPAQDLQGLGHAVGPRHHAVHQIRPVERPDQLRRVAQAQLPGDVVADAGRGGGGEGVQRGRGEAIAKHGELAVFGPKVMPPVADTVGLVDGESLHSNAGQQIEQTGVHQPLRGHEQQP